MSEAPCLAARDDKLGQEDLRTEPDTKVRNVRAAEDTGGGKQSGGDLVRVEFNLTQMHRRLD